MRAWILPQQSLHLEGLLFVCPWRHLGCRMLDLGQLGLPCRCCLFCSLACQPADWRDLVLSSPCLGLSPRRLLGCETGSEQKTMSRA